MSVKLAKVERFLRVGRNDEAHLAFEIDADLTSVFSWNTKQLFVWLAAEYSTPKHVKSSVSVWDRIVESKEDAHLVLPFVRNKYKLVDNGAGLRGNVKPDDGVADHAEGRGAAEGERDVSGRVYAARGVPGAAAAAATADRGVRAPSMMLASSLY